MFLNIFIGLIFCGVGITVILKAFYIHHQVLYFGWAEEKLGPGGGTNGYRYLGLALIVLGVLSVFGVINIGQDAYGKSQPTTPQSEIVEMSSAIPQYFNPRPTLIGN
jgi:hypothetical protein